MPVFSRRLPASLLMALVFLLPACTLTMHTGKDALPASQLLESADLREAGMLAEQMAQAVGKQRVLVIFDLDNTLLAMEQDLGSDQWYYWQKNLRSENRCDPRVVTDRLAAQGALYFASAMRPTQADGAGIVRQIQDDGFTSIIITSRGPEFAAASFRELRRNGFDFTRQPLGSGETLRFSSSPDGRETLYEAGVYLTAGQDKGQMLLALLKATASPLPRAIVMADDKQENLQNVLDALSELPVSVQALRYNREDARVAAFDADQAAADWQRAEPALLQLQEVFGPDNFRLPQPAVPEGCAGLQR